MRKNLFKKVLAFGLAGAMALGMTVTAFGETTQNPIRINDATTMSVPLTKTLYFKNADADTAVYEPNITYNYTVSSADPNGATVKDAKGNQVVAKPGDMRAFGVLATAANQTKVFNIVYDAHHNPVTVPANGIGVTKKIEMSVDGSAITSADGDVIPGVYRYKVEETTNVTKAAAGIVEGSNADILYLDLFITNDGKVTGATIHDPGFTPTDNVDNDEDGDHQDNQTPSENTNGKTTGFGDGTDPTGDDPINDPNDDGNPDDTTNQPGQKTGTTEVAANFDFAKEDLYTTYNITIAKAVDGTMGDKSHFFPFTTAVSNSIANAAFTFKVTDNDSENVAATRAVVGNGGAYTTSDISLKDAGKLTLLGLPSVITGTGVSATVSEKNDTADTYKVNAKKNDTYLAVNGTTTSASTFVDVAKNGNAAAAIQSFKDATTPTITFTNKLDAVSPTGLALRYAPYIIMIGAAIALVAFSRRRRENA